MEIITDDVNRGAIYADGKMLFKGFPTSEEYTDINFCISDVSKYRFFECLEGTLIRVFNHEDVWYTSTTKKLDAFKSKWASHTTSFGESFAKELRKLDDTFDCSDDKDYLNLFYDKYLCKTTRYTFMLLPSDDERIVCDVRSDRIVFIGTEDSETHCQNFDTELPPFTKRREILGISSSQDAINYVREKCDYKQVQGLLLFDKEGTSIKLMSQEYTTRYEIRGNVSSLKFRYLQLRPFIDKLKVFFELYPHMRDVCEGIEDSIYEVCKHLHTLYMQMYIDSNINIPCTYEEQLALKQIHAQYNLTRQRTTKTKINDIMTSWKPTRLNKLLQEYHLRMKSQKQ